MEKPSGRPDELDVELSAPFRRALRTAERNRHGKTYYGRAAGLGGERGQVLIVDRDGQRQLPHRLDVRDHSPTGFNWGYGGSGPAQLALALLCDFLEDEEVAGAVYQGFKWAVISTLDEGRDWRLTGEDVFSLVVDLILDEGR